MNFLFAFVFFIIALFLSFTLGSREWQVAFVGLSTIVGFLLGQSMSLSKQLKDLRQSLSDDWEARNNKPVIQATEVQTNQQNSESTVFTDLDQPTPQNITDYSETIETASASVKQKNDASNAKNNQASDWDSSKTVYESTEASENLASSLNTTSSEPNLIEKVTRLVASYFTGGNIFVRIGIIILFFGVSFLLKYVSDRGMFPIEYRLIGVVIGAMFLLGLGWRLRHKNETYALLLQGAGIGILYLDIYAAYNLYQLIPSLATFALLFVVSMFCAALAVMQNSKSLAVLGFSGGFIAPILASSGSNNHIGLFSYYAVLNVAIVVIAWFKAWRELNLLGFAFTFIIGTVWGVMSYNSSKFDSTEPFLIIFFVFYVLIAVLYALRQPPKLRGYVDGTLIFGIPLAASALQYNLVKDFEYGVSISSFVMGAFYMVLAWFIWKRKGNDLKLLSEAFLALGVIYASMAIPFALAPTQTAAAWALEGAGFIWLGSRQNRLSVRAFGVLLQFSAGVIFLARFEYIADVKAFINGEFISTMMLAVAGILSAWILIKPFKGQKNGEKFISPVLLIWGLVWLVAGFSKQLIDHFPEEFAPSTIMIFISMLSVFLGVLATRSTLIWKHAFIASFVMFLIILLMAFAQFVFSIFSSSNSYHPSIWYGWLAWPIVFVAYYFLLYKAEKQALFPRFQNFFHSVLLLFIVLLITIEGTWWILKKLELHSAWLGIWYAVPATLAMWLIIKAKFWPFSTHKNSYRHFAAVLLAIALSLWSFVALVDKGLSEPLPWIPLLNPIDVMLGIVFITLFKWWQSIKQVSVRGVSLDTISNLASDKYSISNKLFNRRLFVVSFALLGFLWLNFTLFRIAHHWFDVAYNADAMFNSSLVQTTVSIFWAFTGVLLTLYASRKNYRMLWIMGAALLGLVVIKLFTIDFSALGSLGRIISFLVVGALLTSIGYFAPLPEKDNDTDTDSKNATVDEANDDAKKETEKNNLTVDDKQIENKDNNNA